MSKISIIMPVYNVEKYVAKTIESVLAQTFKDFEFFAIDDGSIDNSGKICDEYAKKDSRLKVIHKKNGGAPEARNVAIEKAIEECINCNVLKDFLLERKAEAMHTLLTEYDEEEAMEYFKQRAYEDGIVKGELQLIVSNICKKMIKNKSIEQIADELEEDVSKIQKIYDIAKEFAPDYNVEKIMAKLG